jgi:alpha/beta superfamily hydrolase
MNPQTERLTIAGPAGALECAIDRPADAPRGVAVVCHPHPLHGGTMDNKVAQTLARAFVQLGYVAVRFNYRGVGQSEGGFGDAIGETDDAMAVIAKYRDPALPLALAGFSFGGFVAATAATRLPAEAKAERIVLIGPSTKELSVPTVPEDTLVIHGETDDVVPLSATLDWARLQVLPVVVVPGVGHFFHGQLTLLKNLVINAWRR